VHEYIADITRRLPHQGYMAIAPELMLRQGKTSSYTEMGKLIAEVVSKVPDEQVMGDLDACVTWPPPKVAMCLDWASQVFAGEGASLGCTLPTTQR